MITIEQYYMKRDRAYANELTDEKRNNAAITVSKVNLLIAMFQAAGVALQVRPDTQSPVSSGWRPAKVNGITAGAAPNSKHMTCQAIDLYDPDGDIDEWALANPKVLADIGLWQEHPAATKSWAHFQIVPPKSGNRVFYP
jgi:uncharacterized protein YcbK (DUF882 family)